MCLYERDPSGIVRDPCRPAVERDDVHVTRVAGFKPLDILHKASREPLKSGCEPKVCEFMPVPEQSP